MRAQTALEYLIVISIGLAIFTVVSALAFRYVNDYQAELWMKKTEIAADEIVWSAKSLLSQSRGASTRIRVELPVLEYDSYIHARELKLSTRYGNVIRSWKYGNFSGSLPSGGGTFFMILKHTGDILVYPELPVGYINITTFNDCAAQTLNYTAEILNSTLQPKTGELKMIFRKFEGTGNHVNFSGSWRYSGSFPVTENGLYLLTGVSGETFTTVVVNFTC
ncbi:MAG: hypothetical protein GXO63_02840 [Candidatus Micrarchaeota archaeon]|nr:hypothetical protein [Candidatus Micrarchaeota archaeon]